MLRLIEIFSEEENLYGSVNKRTGRHVWGHYDNSPYVPFYLNIKGSSGFKRGKLFQFSKYSPGGATNTTLGVPASEYFADPMPALLVSRGTFYVLS